MCHYFFGSQQPNASRHKDRCDFHWSEAEPIPQQDAVDRVGSQLHYTSRHRRRFRREAGLSVLRIRQDPAQDGIRCRGKTIWKAPKALSERLLKHPVYSEFKPQQKKTARGKTWFSEMRTTTTKQYDVAVVDTRVMKTHGSLLRKLIGRDNGLIVLDAKISVADKISC